MLGLHTLKQLSRRWPVVAAAAAGVLLGGCKDLLGPLPPPGTVRLTELPAEYEAWWTLTQRCSGLQGDLRRIQWHVLPGVETIPGKGGAAGVYYSRGHQIVLVEGVQRDGGLVRHEMLHALLRRGSHPREAFVDRCGGIVSCGGDCHRDTGGPPVRAPDAPIVDASTLTVSTEVEPRTVSLSTDTRGCVTVVVSATNHRATPVRVRLRGGMAGLINQSFSWWVDGYGGGGISEPDSVLPFAPGETRRYTFDCAHIGTRGAWTGLAPGEHLMRGHVRDAYSDAPFTVVP